MYQILFAVLLLYLISYFWGRVFSKKFQLSLFPEIELLLGLALQLFSFFIIVHISSPLIATYILIALTIPVMFTIKGDLKPKGKILRVYWFYIIPALIIAHIPSDYFDPLNYHLASARFWAEEGAVKRPDHAIAFFHSSYFDYFYMMPQLVFKNLGLKGLVYSQVSSQVMHLLYGAIPAGLVLFRLLRLFNVKYTSLHIFLVVMFLSRASLQHKAFIAKNDWVAIAFTLAAAYLFLTFKNDLVRKRIAGFLMGLVFAMKFTSVMGIVPFIFVFGLSFFKAREILNLTIPFLLGCLPFLIRNLVWTDNPFFPLLDGFFNSELMSQTWKVGFKSFEGSGIKFSNLYPKWVNLLGFFLFNVFYPLGFMFKNKFLRRLWWGNTIVILLFSVATGASSELRALGAISCFISLLSLALIMEKGSNFIAKKGVFKGLIVFIFLVGFINASYNPYSQLRPISDVMTRVWNYSNLTDYVYEEFYGVKLFEKLKNVEGRVATIGDLTPYYLQNKKLIKIWDYPELDRKLYQTKSIEEVVGLIKSYGIRYLILESFHFDPYYNPKIIRELKNYLIKCENCSFYRDDQFVVIDLEKI